jgi:MFS family permease
MEVLDTTIVNVALPSIRTDLQFTADSLAWVVNAYMLTFGGFLLLGGRMGDLFGQRKIFLVGIALFTLASLGCGFAHTQSFLIAMRSVQGVGAAIISAVALSLVMNLFTEPVERAKAMGVYGFVASGGGSIGVLLGGVLTGSSNSQPIFLKFDMKRSIGLAPITQPPGCGKETFPSFPSTGPKRIMEALNLFDKSLVNVCFFAEEPSRTISPFLLFAIFAPKPLIISDILFTSSILGIFESFIGPENNRAEAIMGKAPFLEPFTLIVPFSFLSPFKPSTTNISSLIFITPF